MGRKEGHPLLLDENFKPKPAYFKQVEMLEKLGQIQNKNKNEKK